VPGACPSTDVTISSTSSDRGAESNTAFSENPFPLISEVRLPLPRWLVAAAVPSVYGMTMTSRNERRPNSTPPHFSCQLSDSVS
jgi:hypothetical protein